MVYMGPLWVGSTSLQRLEAFQNLTEIDVYPLDSGARVSPPPGGPIGFWRRVRWKLGWPADIHGERQRLLKAVEALRPDAVFIDSSKVLTRRLLQLIRSICNPLLVYYIPDDVIAAHNHSRQLLGTFPEWDLFFTTKSFNVSELTERGVRRPMLIGKAYDLRLHRPMTSEEVGAEYEHFDLAFIGGFERERLNSINRLAQAGFSVVIYGNGWSIDRLHRGVSLRSAVYGDDYTRSLHVAKISLCFLRRINRDRITQRSVEIPAITRPMLAERTDEHNAHFVDGFEYIGFSDDNELLAQARRLLGDESLRRSVAAAGRLRCLKSGYSTVDRAREMMGLMTAIQTERNGRAS